MDFSQNDHRWCAVQVKSQHEQLVAVGLRARGYEEFLPVQRVDKQWSDRHKQIEVPLFAGYVFCRFNSKAPWSIVATPGVIRIVGTRKEITVIEDQEIEAIQKVAQSGKPAEPCNYACVGDHMRITSGPLAGVEGIVTDVKRKRRLVLSVHLIQRSISVEVDGCDMILVSPRPARLPSGSTTCSASEESLQKGHVLAK